MIFTKNSTKNLGETKNNFVLSAAAPQQNFFTFVRIAGMIADSGAYCTRERAGAVAPLIPH